MSDFTMIESLDGQLQSLYRDREILEERFGVSSAEEISRMIENLEAQLRDLYNSYGSCGGLEGVEQARMLSRIEELSSVLDPMYSQKSVSFFLENNQPVLRAEWHEAIQQGDDQ
ncbi:MAG: hypothetical protein AAF108_06540 [Planctomycetota bacterium]